MTVDLEGEGHLQVATNTQGLRYMPPILGVDDIGEVGVRESSEPTAPHLWLMAAVPADTDDPDESRLEVVNVHLTAVAALQLAEQLRWFVENHYRTP